MANKWGKKYKQWQILFSSVLKTTADSDCSHEIKMLAPWKKSYDKPRQHIKKQRHHLANKGPYSQSYGFPAVMYGCESCTIKAAECRRIDAFELWCWRRLLRITWITRRSNQSILKEINPEYSLEGLMLKLQYFGHLMRRADSLEKPFMLGKTKCRRRRGNRLWDVVKDREAQCAAVHWVTKSHM